MGTSYSLQVVFGGVSIPADAFACHVTMGNVTFTLGSLSYTLTADRFTFPVTMRNVSFIASAASTGELPSSTTITPSVTGTLPFCIGQAFKLGAVGSGAALAGLQMDVLTRWSDNSVKHAIISGTAAMTSGAAYSLSMAIGTAATGATITTSDLAAALSSGVTITAGAFGSAVFGATEWASPAQTVASGPKMSSWTYRKQIGSDTHLVAWLEIRLWSTGHCEVFPWVENCYLGVASPTNKSATYTFSLGGTTRFSAAIDIKHHTRIPLVSSTEGSTRTFSHWLGTDPGVVPAHDGAYLRATKAIPNAYWAAPSSTILDATQQTYTPNTLAGDDNATGATGGSGAIVHATDSRYVNSGDIRAWKAMMTHALSAGSWSWHYRDSSTNRPPLYASYATASIGDATIPAGTGGTNHTGGPAMTHMASYAYLPFLVTGRWWFLEELQFQATWGFLSVSPAYRNNANHTIDTGSGFTVRGGAWSMNLAAQAASITPTSDALSAQFIATWERTTANLYGKYVSGTIAGGVWVSPLGVLGSYSGDVGQPTPWPPTIPGTAWWDGMYQHNYLAMVLGYSSDIGIAQSSASLTNHTAARNHSYKLVIGRADDGFNGRYNWRRFICFAAPIGTDATGLPVDTYYSTHDQMHTELLAGYSLASISSAYGLSLKQHSSDSDLTSSDTSRNYGSTALAALAMAVEHGVAGASEGYYRITGASNYASAFSTYVTDDEPGRAVTPRTPSWAPSTGVATDLGTTSLNTAVGRTVNWWNAWSTIGWAPWWGTHGSVIAAGGGHSDGNQNDIARLDVATQTWSMIKTPPATSYLKAASGNNADPSGDGWMYANATAGDFTMQTGESPAQHFYGGLLAIPDNAISGGGGNGWLFTCGQSAIPENGNNGSRITHKLRMGVDQLWTTHGTAPSHQNGNNGSVYDPSRGRVWYPLQVGSDPSNTYAYRVTSTGSIGSQVMAGGLTWQNSYDSLNYSSRHDCLIRVMEIPSSSPKDYTRIEVIDLATNTAYRPTQTGTPPPTTNANFGAIWSDAWNCIVYLRGQGDNVVYFCKPSGNPRTSSWAWTSQTLSTGTPRASQNSGGNAPAFTRVRHVASAGNVLIWCADARYPVQVIGVTPP